MRKRINKILYFKKNYKILSFEKQNKIFNLKLKCLFQVYKNDTSGKASNLLDVDKKASRGDALSTCDSGSEVSDEGYKSSQVNNFRKNTSST
jgi:hypothetical protein